MKSDSYRLDVNLPADLYTNERSQVQVSLHFAYGAEMRADSVVNVILNGQFATAIPLSDPQGGAFLDYKISIPLRSFKPGHNSLVIQPHMMPLITDFCTAIQEENLVMVLYDDSTISIPSASHYTAVPNLALFSESGFPLITSRQDSTFSVYLSKADAGTVGAAWTVLAKLAQKAGQVLVPSTLSTQPIHPQGSILAFGPVGTLDPPLADGSPVRFGPNGGIGIKGSLLGEVSGNILPGGRPLLTSYISPFDSNGVAFLFTAASSEILERRIHDLVKPELWDSLKGDTVVWADTRESLFATSLSAHLPIGSVDLTTSLGYYFSTYPQFWLGVVTTMLVVLVVLSRWLLMKRQAKQH
jgi:hypothetical protein